MDTTTIFVLGSLSSLGVILLGFGIYTILKMNKRINKLEDLPKLIDLIEERSRADFNALHNSIDSAQTSIRSYVDSRLDKLVGNVSNEISNDRQDIGDLRKLVEEIATNHSDRLATLETHKKIEDDKIVQINS
jgi:hypothetical protein